MSLFEAISLMNMNLTLSVGFAMFVLALWTYMNKKD